MKAFIRLTWRWSWIVTLPTAAIFLYWGWVTMERFYTFAVRYDASPFRVSLVKTGQYEFHHLVRRIQLAASTPVRQSRQRQGGLRTIQLFVPEPSLAQLNSNLPHSGFEYVKGGLWNGKVLNEVKIRYRGDFLTHWVNHKKSFRIKTKKKSLFEGMRSFNLIAPKTDNMLESYLGYRLAAMMGLMTPRVEMVNVNVNGEPRGIHVLVEQLEELTLRRQGRMPGDLYVGELVAKDAYRGISNQLFEHPGLWEKAATNNHYPADSYEPLKRLITLIKNSKVENAHVELSQLLDMNAFGVFSAFETLAQSFHYGDTHNWRLYYDPARSHFIPIVWDPLAWHTNRLLGGGKPAWLDMMPSVLHSTLFRNSDFLRARHTAIKKFFDSGLDKTFLREVSDTLAAIKPDVILDPNLGTLLGGLGDSGSDPMKVILAQQRYRDNIEKVFRDVREGYLATSGEVLYVVGENSENIPILISGRRPIERLVLDYARPLSGTISAWLRYWKNGKRVEIDVSGGVTVSGARLGVKTTLLAEFVPISVKVQAGREVYRQEIRPAYYELLLQGVARDNRPVSLLVDRGGVTLESAERMEELKQRSFHDMHVIVHPQPPKRPLIWEGIVEIDGVREISDTLIIRPGTTVRLTPRASLILNGRLLAEGTHANPIRFIPARDGQNPWGAVVLKGQGANGSRLRYCDFVGGSGLKGDLFEYSAMFSIHDVSGVRVERCLFRNNKLVDDMVHAVYSNVQFVDSEFLGATSDALDLDISEGVMERCRFIGSGNDAIDLMTTRAIVIDTVLQDSGDKGISVGEESHLLAINSVFTGNNIGVESKDGSVAVLYNVDLKRNGQALHAMRKNWRYDVGGKVFLYKGNIVDGSGRIAAETKSKIWIYDSFIDPKLMVDSKRIKLDATVDWTSNTQAKDLTLWRLPEERHYLEGMDETYWERVNPKTRGAMIGAARH